MTLLFYIEIMSVPRCVTLYLDTIGWTGNISSHGEGINIFTFIHKGTQHEILAAQSGDVNYFDSRSKTPLYHALERNNLVLAEIMIDCGASTKYFFCHDLKRMLMMKEC